MPRHSSAQGTPTTLATPTSPLVSTGAVSLPDPSATMEASTSTGGTVPTHSLDPRASSTLTPPFSTPALVVSRTSASLVSLHPMPLGALALAMNLMPSPSTLSR